MISATTRNIAVFSVATAALFGTADPLAAVSNVPGCHALGIKPVITTDESKEDADKIKQFMPSSYSLRKEDLKKEIKVAGDFVAKFGKDDCKEEAAGLWEDVNKDRVAMAKDFLKIVREKLSKNVSVKETPGSKDVPLIEVFENSDECKYLLVVERDGRLVHKIFPQFDDTEYVRLRAQQKKKLGKKIEACKEEDKKVNKGKNITKEGKDEHEFIGTFEDWVKKNVEQKASPKSNTVLIIILIAGGLILIGLGVYCACRK